MTSKEKEKFIKQRLGVGFRYTVRQVQEALKFKFGSGVKNEVIGAIKQLMEIERIEKGNKWGNEGNKDGKPPKPPTPPKKNKAESGETF